MQPGLRIEISHVDDVVEFDVVDCVRQGECYPTSIGATLASDVFLYRSRGELVQTCTQEDHNQECSYWAIGDQRIFGAKRRADRLSMD